ncbi:MAG TPA: tetratricopeptide repeat protein [Paenibacillus sp.]
MKENQQPGRSKQAKVLPISMDAGFFFERAVSSLDRFHYDKALKYFRKAVEYEPDNPVNHCNMAGILSEMGNYEDSNTALSIILEKIDPTMTECYFYMANNYANMDMFEEAENALITYLEEDPNGQFLGEAEEMMELLQYELERPAKVTKIKSLAGVLEHDRARELLEQGKFTEAVKLLESIVEDQPDFWAARNNLALGYYYMGKCSKAIETIYGVLEQEPGNLHALCNLAILYQHEGETTLLKELEQKLRKIFPFHQEHLFKLATTMGVLGAHDVAYRHFRRLLKDDELRSDPALYHYTAVAACNIGRLTEAETLWRHVGRLDPGSEISEYYLSRIEEMSTGTRPIPVHYHYHLPFEEQIKQWELPGEGVPADLADNPLVRSSFFWALRYGDDRTKLQVIQAFGLIGDHEVEEALKSFLLEPDEDIYLKDLALYVLRSLGVNYELPVCTGEATLMIDPSRTSSQLPIWKNEWQAVLDLASEQMRSNSDIQQQHDLESLWVQYLNLSYPDTPSISHIEGWAAALEYLTAKMNHRPMSYEKVAERYGISSSTVRRYCRRIEEVCGEKDALKTIFPMCNNN